MPVNYFRGLTEAPAAGPPKPAKSGPIVLEAGSM